MPLVAVLAPYPWQALENLSRATVQRTRRARRALEASLRLERIGAGISALLETPVTAVVRELKAASVPPRNDYSFAFGPVDSPLAIFVRVEPELAAELVGRALGRAPELPRPGRELDAQLSGALAALGLEAARRAGGTWPLLLRRAAPKAEPGLGLSASLLLGQRAHAVEVWVSGLSVDEPERLPSQQLRHAGALPVELRLVVQSGVLSQRELGDLAPGDAFVPGGSGWQAASGGPALLAASNQEWGVRVDLAPDGQIVVRGEVVELMADEAEVTEREGALAGAALDAPLLVRVEMGAVRLTAREWAALRPGDVIETGRRIAEPVSLRVAGREVARGELVSVDGELGVRIRELLQEGSDE